MIRTWLPVVLGIAVACGGGGKGSSSDNTHPKGDGANEVRPRDTVVADAAPEPLEFEEIELGTSQDYIPLLKVGATELGCSLVAEEPDPPAVAYQCEEGTVFAAQVGTVLRYTCQNISKQQCNALLERINKKVLEAAGGD